MLLGVSRCTVAGRLRSGGPGGLPGSGGTGVGRCPEDLCTPWSGAGGGGLASSASVGQRTIIAPFPLYHQSEAVHTRGPECGLSSQLWGGAVHGVGVVRRLFLLAPPFYSGVGPTTESLVLPSPVLVAPAPRAFVLALALALALAFAAAE
jgi:hypothetical protein